MVLQPIVSVAYIVAGSVQDYDASAIFIIKGVFAQAAGVNVSGVTITIAAGSVRISVDISVLDSAAAAATATRLTTPNTAEGIFASADVLKTALAEAGAPAGVQVIVSPPEATVMAVRKGVAPSTDSSSSLTPSSGLPPTELAIVAIVALVLLVGCCCVRRAYTNFGASTRTRVAVEDVTMARGGTGFKRFGVLEVKPRMKTIKVEMSSSPKGIACKKPTKMFNMDDTSSSTSGADVFGVEPIEFEGADKGLRSNRF